MAVLDKFSDAQSISAGAYLDLKPGAGQEVTIHNVHWALPSGTTPTIDILFTDGVDSILFESSSTKGSKEGLVWNCTNTKYYRIRNNASTATLMCFDGVYTKS